jgi:hypothetical protein
MGRIADYVATLSPAEREQFKDLIEECTMRESSIQANASKAQSAISQLAQQQQQMCLKIAELQEAGQKLLDTVSRLYLRTVPAPRKMH